MDPERINLTVELRPTGDLRPDEANPRNHAPEQIEAIVRSMREFGWTNPILVDEDAQIIAGHGRLMAAKELGLETVPVIVLAGLSAAQRRAYMIADNQLTLAASWDLDLLRESVDALAHANFDLDLLGFDDSMMAILGHAAEGEMPDLRDSEPVAETITFTLTPLQMALVKGALEVAKGTSEYGEEEGTNENGKALAVIARSYDGEGD